MNNNAGGYQIINLDNQDLLQSPTIPGLYDLIEGTKKPVRLSRINFGGVEKHDVVSMPVVSGSDYVFENIYGYDISIDSDDNVSVASTAIVYKSTIEGGTLDNAKPIYCHPITISNTVDTSTLTLKGTMLIFNNAETAFTKNTFIYWLDNLFNEVGSVLRLMISGGIHVDGELSTLSYIGKTTATDYYIIGVKSSGGEFYKSYTTEEFVSLIAEFFDGVNKIN